MYTFRPKKHLGQNFMTDPLALDMVVKSADLKPDDVVLEVGPGTGLLTKELLKTARKVVAIEKDKKLVERLLGDFKGEKNLEVIESDILKFNFEKYFQPSSPPKDGRKSSLISRRGLVRGDMKQSYKVVANIPYYLTSHLIQKFLYASHKPSIIILTIQKEVGERIVASAGQMSLLSVSVQLVADAEIIQVEIPGQARDGFGNKKVPLIIPKTSFTPSPQVDSVIIKITPKNKHPEVTDTKLFFQIAKACFIGKRKQIHNTLKHNLKLSGREIDDILDKCKISPLSRPQELSMEEWISLYQSVKDIY